MLKISDTHLQRRDVSKCEFGRKRRVLAGYSRSTSEAIQRVRHQRLSNSSLPGAQLTHSWPRPQRGPGIRSDCEKQAYVLPIHAWFNDLTMSGAQNMLPALFWFWSPRSSSPIAPPMRLHSVRLKVEPCRHENREQYHK